MPDDRTPDTPDAAEPRIITTTEAKEKFSDVFRKAHSDATNARAGANERKHSANAMARLFESWSAADTKPEKIPPTFTASDRAALRALAWKLAGVRCPRCDAGNAGGVTQEGHEKTTRVSPGNDARVSKMRHQTDG